MAVFGSTINPALGRVDYSQLGQGIAQGGILAAQGMANLGQSISEGFKSYIQNREKNSILEGKNAGMLRAMEKDPVLNADPDFIKLKQKQEKQGGLNLADNSKMNAMLTTYSEQSRLQEEGRARQLAMEANRFQLDQAKANQQRADNDRAAMAKIWAEAGRMGKIPDVDQVITAGLYYGASPEVMASMVGMSQNSVEFGMKVEQNRALAQKLKLENDEAAARADRISKALTLMPNGFREASDGNTRVFQYIDFANGQVKSELLKPGNIPANVVLLQEKQKDAVNIFREYVGLLNRPDRDSQENINDRAALTEKYNATFPKSDNQFNQTRENLDILWGQQSPVTTAPGKGGGATPPPKGKSNISGVSTAAPGAQPTPAPAPAAATQGGFNLIEDMRRKFGGGAQAAPVTTPAVDTTVGAATPSAPPPVDLSAPPSIAAAVRFGDTRPPASTPAIEKALKSAMNWADKNLGPNGKMGLGAMAETLSKPAFESARAQELSLAQSLAERSDTPVKTFEEAMVNFGYRKTGGGQFEYKGPAYRGGANPEREQSSSAIPFERAGLDGTFMDREGQATAEQVYRPFDINLMERTQGGQQGGLPQIKLSPAAQKIANELRNSNRERGKAPEFFLEASTGDNGKRTRVKLASNELFAILTNNRMPNLAPVDVMFEEESRRLSRQQMDQQMRMNELMRQYRPPARRAR